MSDSLTLVVSPDTHDAMVARAVQSSDGMTVHKWVTRARVGDSAETRTEFDRVIDVDLREGRFKRAGATDWTRAYAPVVPIEYVRPQAINVPSDEMRMASRRHTLDGSWVPMLTIGELKQILLQSENLRDNEPVALFCAGEWRYVASYNLSGDDGFDAGLTLHPGSVFDSRNH